MLRSRYLIILVKLYEINYMDGTNSLPRSSIPYATFTFVASLNTLCPITLVYSSW